MIHKAEKTLAAIEHALNQDKCGQFRQNLAFLLPKMEDAYRATEKPFRRHLGASGIGKDCSRELQLDWRWAMRPQFPERILRLFNRGHLEEARFLSMLMCIPDVELWYETDTGGQFKWQDFNGHYGSALDGIARNIPDLPAGVACYTEFKTASSKMFAKVEKEGVRAQKWEHFVQMQQCMKYYSLDAALYLVVNKDTDQLYGEIVYFEQQIADQYSRRAGEIIFSVEALPRISNLRTFWKCKFCDKKAVCQGDAIPEINCRTCAHWSAESDGSFSCNRNNDEIYRESVYDGCSEHVYDPTLISSLSYVGGDAVRNACQYQTRDGEQVWQGPNDITSEQFKQRFTK